MIYLMAQGKGSRWKEDLGDSQEYALPCRYKQLIPIMGVPNIARTIRMVHTFNPDINNRLEIIAEGEMFADWVVIPRHVKTLQWPGPNILYGISQLLHQDIGGLHTKRLDAYTFILGDVIFSYATMQLIMENQSNYTVYGRKVPNPVTNKVAGEIFGLVVPIGKCAKFLQFVDRLIESKAEKLWHLQEHPDFSGTFTEIDDWTDDVDSPQDYAEFFPLLEEAAIADDMKWKS